MTHFRVYEYGKYKPLRAFLLCIAILTDIVAVLSVVAGIFDNKILICAAVAVAIGFALRRISLYSVYSYEYELRGNLLFVKKKYIGKVKELLRISSEDIINMSEYKGEKGVEIMFAGEEEKVYELTLSGGKKVALMLDNYTHSILLGGGEI